MAYTELQAIDETLYSKLSAGTALCALVGGTAAPRIYSGLAPMGTAAPYVVYQHMAGTDEITVGASRALLSALYMVKGVAQEAAWATAGSIAAEADALMSGTAGTLGVNVRAIHREQTVQYDEDRDGVRWAHCGGLYRVHCYK